MRAFSNPVLWIVAAVMVLSLAGIFGTMCISQQHGVSDGYIPPEER